MSRPISQIARQIRAEWSRPYFGAVPYLDAMLSLESANDSYGEDSGKSVIPLLSGERSGLQGSRRAAAQGRTEGRGVAMIVDLTPEEAAILREAIDSHIYWQLADEAYRNNGFVEDPGSDDPDMRAQIQASERLAAKLGGVS